MSRTCLFKKYIHYVSATISIDIIQTSVSATISLILSRPLYELYTISIGILCMGYIQSLLMILSRPLYGLYTISIDIIQTSVWAIYNLY